MGERNEFTRIYKCEHTVALKWMRRWEHCLDISTLGHMPPLDRQTAPEWPRRQRVTLCAGFQAEIPHCTVLQSVSAGMMNEHLLQECTLTRAGSDSDLRDVGRPHDSTSSKRPAVLAQHV